MEEKDINRAIRRTEKQIRIFAPSDLFLVLIYRPDKLPRSPEWANFYLKSVFLSPLREARKAAGRPLKYLSGQRWSVGDIPPEHRIIINLGEETAAELEALWPYGGVLVRPLSEAGSLSELARQLYLDAYAAAGVPERRGKHCLIHSRELCRM